MSDAHKIHNALPDIQIERHLSDQIRIHKNLIFQTMYRLKTQGVKVALVARKLQPNGVYSYRIDFRSDEEEES